METTNLLSMQSANTFIDGAMKKVRIPVPMLNYVCSVSAGSCQFIHILSAGSPRIMEDLLTAFQTDVANRTKT